MALRLALLLFTLSLIANIGFALADLSWWMLPALLLGWYAADALSGIVHMVMDYYPCRAEAGLDRLYFYTGSRESAEYQAMFRAAMARLNPLERLVYDFKNHHPRPDALGRRTMLRQIGSSIVAGSLPLSLLLNLACLLLPVPGWVMAAFVSLLIGGTFAQYFHGSLHRQDNPPIIHALRRVGLLMSPAAHQLHHDTLKRDFSTNCGWSNALLNQVFRFGYARGWFCDAGLEPSRTGIPT